MMAKFMCCAAREHLSYASNPSCFADVYHIIQKVPGPNKNDLVDLFYGHVLDSLKH
jgi:hypothetical protein